jgi:uncharacterized Fe-S radical SAM superfamily protein PflX
MENLFIQQTEETPEINFNINGQLLIRGISIPENITSFYLPVINWIKEFGLNTPSSISLVFEIEYINTSSTRVYMDIIKRVYSLKEKCPNTNIVWKYAEDDEDNLDLGKDLEYSAKAIMKFEII